MVAVRSSRARQLPKTDASKVLPMLENLKQNLSLVSSGVSTGPNLEKHHELTILLSRVRLKYLDEIPMHDIWCASCVIHPGLSSFSFMPPSRAKLARSLGESLVSQMISEIAPVHQHVDRDETSQRVEITPTGGNLGSSLRSLATNMSFLSRAQSDTDELTSYKSLVISPEEKRLLSDDAGIVELWLNRVETFPNMSKVALRLCITPASSASSE